MSRLNSILNIACVIVITIGASACLPKKNSGGGGDSSSSNNRTANLFSVTSVRSGSGVPNVDPLGRYYSRDPAYTITGACRGDVAKVLIEITPLSQAMTQESATCSGETFTWSKTFASENFFAVKLIATDSHDLAISGLSNISKTLVYDITPPTAPTFLTPTTTTSYIVSDGSTQVTITGQVLNEVNYLIGPTGAQVILSPNADSVHQDYSSTVSVPLSSTTIANFAAMDYAGNTATIAMTIQSLVSLNIPVAANELGGSSDFVAGGLFIHSTIGLFQGAVVNQQVQLSTGSAGIVGDMQ